MSQTACWPMPFSRRSAGNRPAKTIEDLPLPERPRTATRLVAERWRTLATSSRRSARGRRTGRRPARGTAGGRDRGASPQAGRRATPSMACPCAAAIRRCSASGSSRPWRRSTQVLRPGRCRAGRRRAAGRAAARGSPGTGPPSSARGLPVEAELDLAVLPAAEPGGPSRTTSARQRQMRPPARAARAGRRAARSGRGRPAGRHRRAAPAAPPPPRRRRGCSSGRRHICPRASARSASPPHGLTLKCYCEAIGLDQQRLFFALRTKHSTTLSDTGRRRRRQGQLALDDALARPASRGR